MDGNKVKDNAYKIWVAGNSWDDMLVLIDSLLVKIEELQEKAWKYDDLSK